MFVSHIKCFCFITHLNHFQSGIVDQTQLIFDADLIPFLLYIFRCSKLFVSCCFCIVYLLFLICACLCQHTHMLSLAIVTIVLLSLLLSSVESSQLTARLSLSWASWACACCQKTLIGPIKLSVGTQCVLHTCFKKWIQILRNIFKNKYWIWTSNCGKILFSNIFPTRTPLLVHWVLNQF